MKLGKPFLGLISALLIFSCTPEPKEIHYNLDVCAYCKMVITDTRYGTEILTEKGKDYKFDSFECMADYSKENKLEVHQHLVTSFTEPKKLIDGKNCWVLQSESMPSPMGRFLTVFANKKDALIIAEEKGGKVLPLNEALVQL